MSSQAIIHCVSVNLVVGVLAMGASASAQAAAPDRQAGRAVSADQEIGRRFQIDPARLAKPYETPGVQNPALVIPRGDRAPITPPGFRAELYVGNLDNPRQLLVLPNGDILISEQRGGFLTMTRDADGDGRADYVERHASGFNQPYGLAWRQGEILVTDMDGIWSIPYNVGDLRPPHAVERPIADVPPAERGPHPNMDSQRLISAKGVFGLVAGHHNRDLEIDASTGDLLVGVGSAGNLGIEPPVKATIQRFTPDAKRQSTVASGTRNPSGLAFHPQTGALWAVVQERDGLGDQLVPDYLVQVKQGAFYGWPYAFLASTNLQPEFASAAPEKVSATTAPDLLFQPHSATMDLVFYEGAQFPAEYRGDAFVAMRGSWNASQPTGYKIVRVRFQNGRPVGGYENFVTGFWVAGITEAQVWGRPADVAVAKDGALLIADDVGGTVWRIEHVGPNPGAR